MDEQEVRARIRVLVQRRGVAEMADERGEVATIDAELEQLGVNRVPPPGGREHGIVLPEGWVYGCVDAAPESR